MSKARNRLKSWQIFLAYFVVICLGGGTWALLTPQNGSPDEYAHVSYAVKVYTNLDPSTATVSVPPFVRGFPGDFCWQFREKTPATCTPAPLNDTEDWPEIVTSANNYPPLYYWLVGWPLMLWPSLAGLLGMRLISVVLAAGLFAWGAALFSKTQSHPALLPVLFLATTPMTLHLIGSINPSGFEIATTAAFTLAGLAAIKAKTAERKWAWIGVGVAAALAANSRPSSVVWLAAIAVALALLFPRDQWRSVPKNPGFWGGVAIGFLGAVCAIGWRLAAPVELLPGRKVNWSIFSVPGAFMKDAFSIFVQQPVGMVGWLDTAVPPSAALAFLFGLFGVSWLTLISGGRRQLLAALWLVCAWFGGSVALQAAMLRKYGLIWQGRYALPIIVALILISALSLSAKSWPKRAWLSLLVAGLVMHVGVYLAALQRFWFGSGNDRPIRISQLSGWSYASLWVFGGFLAAVTLFAAWQFLRPGPESTSVTSEADTVDPCSTNAL